MFSEQVADAFQVLASSPIDWVMGAKAQSVGDLVFFGLIYNHLHEVIDNFREGVLGRTGRLISGVALILMSVWVFFQGFRIIIGQSRDSMMGLVMNSLRATLIISSAVAFGMAGSDINKLITVDMKNVICEVVTGEDECTLVEQIDSNLAQMQLAMSTIDAVQVINSDQLAERKASSLLMIAGGTAGPAMTGAAMLLMYEVAMALFIGLGPIFILMLLWNATKSLFQRWLLYGVGTMFSLAVLSVMVSISTDVVKAISISFWVGGIANGLLGDQFGSGITTMAIQQGGVGLLLTVLLITTPPMAANFFQGTLGNFANYPAWSGAGMAAGQRPGESGYRGGSNAPTNNDMANNRMGGLAPSLTQNGLNQRVTGAGQEQPQVTTGSRGVANQGGRE